VAISRVQTVEVETAGGVSIVTVNIAAPASGSLIVTAVAIDKSSGGLTVPAGFTLIHDYDSANVSGGFAFKVSNGTETAVTWDWVTNTPAGNAAWVAVYTGLTSDPFDVKVEADSGVTAVTSQTTGTTASTTQADELAVAVMATDTGENADTGRDWTNGFTEFGFSFDPGAGQAGLSIADKVLSAIGTVETTFSTTDVGDQMWASVATFKTLGVSRTIVAFRVPSTAS